MSFTLQLSYADEGVKNFNMWKVMGINRVFDVIFQTNYMEDSGGFLILKTFLAYHSIVKYFTQII